MARLRLEILEFDDLDTWRWRLTEPGGAFVADHEVRLDPADPGRDRFHDLDPNLPDARIEDAGRWIGERVLGAIGPAIAARAPVTVEVHVPEGAEGLLDRPLELGHAGGRPLALHDVSLVWLPPGCAPVPKRPSGERLRVLAVFSVPTDVAGLALRRERYELSRYVVETLVARQNRAIEFRVLQYGVTRERLREVLQEGDGWDVVHFSGHGLAGGLVLETEEGSRDLVEAGDLIELLHPARDQIELVTLFSCLSAASTAASTLRRLGLPPVPADAAPERAPAGRPLTALATRIACRLGCAVLAMRHPIEDGFAIDLSLGLYHRLLDNRQPLPRALQLAIQNAVRAPAGLRPSALAPATPAIFGAPAAELRFQAPAGTPLFFDPRQLRAAGLPREPERFVGRVGQLARASRALAAGSGQSGVLFHGPPGHGRTTCAAELAYRHQDGFGLLAWHDLPGPGADIQDALAGLARTLDARVEGLRLAERVDSRERLEAFLPLLAEFLERRAVLLVLDNLESLLTEAGGWRDARWEPLVAALTGHRGQSRVVLVSRRPPAVLDPGVQVEEIGPLTRVEQALLARELPRLGALIRADEPGPGLARRLLETSGGAPGRLVRADAALADPAAAEALLREAGAAGERPSRPLREVDVLRGRYNALVEKARDLGLTEDRELSALATRVTSLLYDGPIDVAAAAAAVASYQERLAGHDQWADRD